MSENAYICKVLMFIIVSDMNSYKELTYMVIDELKLSSDDSTFTQDHIIFLLNKYRSFILKQRYSDLRKPIPESNYQTLCLELIEVPAISGEPCEGGSYLRSKDKLPITMRIGNPRVYPIDFYQGEITYVSRDRMRYVGYNKFLQNIIYCSIAPDDYLYFKSWNPQFLYLENVKFTAIFEDASAASDYECPSEGEDVACDILDRQFPIEDSLVPPLIELVVKELRGPEYAPKDEQNDANDNLDEMNYYKKCYADMLDNEIHQSKRPGYIEFTGTINGTVGDRVKFSVTSLNSTPAPVILYIFCENNIYIIREAEQKIFRYTGESVEEMVFEMPFLSVQGADIAKAILFEGGCTLPSYEVSAKIHKAMLTALLDKMGKIEGSKVDICKIT